MMCSSIRTGVPRLTMRCRLTCLSDTILARARIAPASHTAELGRSAAKGIAQHLTVYI